MHLFKAFFLLLPAAHLVTGVDDSQKVFPVVSPFENTQDVLNTTIPVNYGLLLYPTFQAIDVFGPMDALNILSMIYKINLVTIAATLDPISTALPSFANPLGSLFSQSVVPTHTFETAPPIDVLVVPGGFGTRVRPDDMTAAIRYIRDTYPSLKYLITVCTGSWLAAQAGVLDGKNATSNKGWWSDAITLGKNVNWIAKARWVRDGNIWTTSGVSAGIDGTLDFIETVYGKEMVDQITNGMEYDRHTDSSWDPWADHYNLRSTIS